MLAGIRFVSKKKESSNGSGEDTTVTEKTKSSSKKDAKRKLLDQVDQSRKERKLLFADIDNDADSPSDGVEDMSSYDLEVQTKANSSTDLYAKYEPVTSTSSTSNLNVNAAKLLKDKLKSNVNATTSTSAFSMSSEGQGYDLIAMKNIQNKKRAELLSGKLREDAASMTLSELVAAEKLDSREHSRSGKSRFSEYDKAYASHLLEHMKPAKDALSDSDNDGEEGRAKTKDERKIDKTVSGMSRQSNHPIKQKVSSKTCSYCTTFDGTNSDLLIAKTLNWRVYFKPRHISLNCLHCLLIPVEHICSSVQCEDGVLAELQQIKQKLYRIYESLDQIPLFVETVIETGSFCHTIIDVIPLDGDQLVDAISSFSMAIQSYEEIGVTDAKRIFHMNPQRPLRNIVPPHLPFTSVEWMKEMFVNRTTKATGTVHVFEDTEEIPKGQFGSSKADFAVDVIGSCIFEADPQKIRDKNKSPFRIDSEWVTQAEQFKSKYLRQN